MKFFVVKAYRMTYRLIPLWTPVIFREAVPLMALHTSPDYLDDSRCGSFFCLCAITDYANMYDMVETQEISSFLKFQPYVYNTSKGTRTYYRIMVLTLNCNS